MPAEKYITSTCTIVSGKIFKNGKPLFEDKTTDVSAFLLAVYHHFGLNYPKFYKMDNLCKLGWLVSEVLLKDSFEYNKYQPEEVGLVLANRNSSLDDDIKYWETAKDIASPSLFVYTLPNIVIGEICIRNNFKGEHAFYIQGQFDAEFIAGQVNYLLDNDILQACICGWVDILGDNYKAVLFLVEKQNEGNLLFSSGNMRKTFGDTLV
ncbi:MAG: hypothetical protein JST32_15490 [Bacteroidetes bacterium]|nr:hypothetical protein [Bacteroidota bacterium]